MNVHERRMTYRVAGEWVGLKRDKAFPSINYLNPNTFSVNWSECVLVRLLDHHSPPLENSLEFEFIGDRFHAGASVLAAGTRVSAVPDVSFLSLTATCLRKLFERQTAVIFSGSQPWQSSKAIYFRSIAVPFSNHEGDLKYGLGAFSHKIANEMISHEDTKTEFLEYRNGGWLSFDEPSRSALTDAA